MAAGQAMGGESSSVRLSTFEQMTRANDGIGLKATMCSWRGSLDDQKICHLKLAITSSYQSCSLACIGSCLSVMKISSVDNLDTVAINLLTDTIGMSEGRPRTSHSAMSSTIIRVRTMSRGMTSSLIIMPQADRYTGTLSFRWMYDRR